MTGHDIFEMTGHASEINGHDRVKYARNGTTCLFAALEVLQGKVIGQYYVRHRHQEFLKFLRRLDAEFPGEVALHLVMDNYGTHTHPNVQAWLKRHPRFVSHFVPTRSSWLNLVERWFGELTRKRIRRGSFASVADLHQAIEEFLLAWNENPKPFVWTATVESINLETAVAAHSVNVESCWLRVAEGFQLWEDSPNG